MFSKGAERKKMRTTGLGVCAVYFKPVMHANCRRATLQPTRIAAIAFNFSPRSLLRHSGGAALLLEPGKAFTGCDLQWRL